MAVSGSTICYQGMSFPLPSLPTGKVPFTGPEDLPGLEAAVREQYRIFDGECAICMDGMQAPSYALVEQAAQAGQFTGDQAALITREEGYVLKFKCLELLGQLQGLLDR